MLWSSTAKRARASVSVLFWAPWDSRIPPRVAILGSGKEDEGNARKEKRNIKRWSCIDTEKKKEEDDELDCNFNFMCILQL